MNDPRRKAKMPEPGEVWAHYKGERYSVVGIGHDALDGRAVVIYENVGWAPGAGLWSRDLGEFLGYTDGHEKRFTLLNGDALEVAA